MIGRTPPDAEILRARIMLIVMLLVFILLGVNLWSIQVAHGHLYADDLERQSARRIRMPGMRGLVYDRHGVRLADNRPNYCLAVYLEELRQPGAWSNTINRVEQLVQQISVIIDIPPQITREDISSHIYRRLPLPLLAWRDLDNVALAKWAENGAGVPGVDVYIEPVRVYPNGAAAGHLLGYVGRADPASDRQEPYHYYMPEMEGKAGIEKEFDEVLRGQAGGRIVRVDVSGYRHGDIRVREPEQGSDLMLALDTRIQVIAERVMADVRGAAVVLDPRNGDVLAMASSPGFDPNIFIPSISSAEWKTLIEDEGKPLLNRAIAGAYTPGSTFKPIVAMAALENRIVTGAKTYNCPGYFQLGRRRFNCWYKPGHGTLNMREALKHSCNVYFYHLGLECGPEVIVHMARALGLGEVTGADVDYERSGLVPDEAWKRKVFNDAWREGDTCNMSIGQGALTATPLQMARVAAAIGNGGYVYRPRVVIARRPPGGEEFEEEPVELINDMHWSPAALDVVRDGMRDVIMAPDGSGRNARIAGMSAAGKTGTAEYGKKGSGKKYGWMIAYAPAEKPRYAIAVVVEEAVSGGVTAAPRVQALMEGIFSGRDLQEGAG